MSYLTDVQKKMQQRSSNLQKNINYGKPRQSPHEGVPQKQVDELLAQKDRLRNRLAGGRMHSDPPMSRMPINAVADKRKGRQRLDKIRTAVRAGAEGPSSSVKNTNKKSPRYGQYYSIEAGKGGNYHVYKGGKKVFVRSRPKAKSIAPNKTMNKLRKQFNPKKGLHNKEYLIDA